MTRDEAAKILEVSPRASRRQCDAAYAKTLGVLTLRLQHETVPHERDVLGRGIRLLGEAYQVFTGNPPPSQVAAPKTGKATKSPPKVKLASTAKPSAPPPPPPAPRRSILNNQPAAAKSRPPAAAAKRPPTRQPRQTKPSAPPPSLDPIAARAWATIAAIVLLAVAFVYGATK